MLVDSCFKWLRLLIYVSLLGGLGVFWSQSSQGKFLEEEFGLTWLFKLRGEIPAPSKIVIVSMDQTSAEILHLGDDPEKWPRSYFTNLIDKLNQQHPAIIAFNIHFGETRNLDGDNILAKTMASSRNVILSNYLKQYNTTAIDAKSQFSYERVINPIPLFQDAALSSSPFPLAKTPTTIKDFWTFKSSAGDIPTFPVTVFQNYLFKETYQEIKSLIKQINPIKAAQLPAQFPPINETTGAQLRDCDQIIEMVRAIITEDQETFQKFSQLLTNELLSMQKVRLLKAWLALIEGGERLYLNHYGKEGSIVTIPFYQVLVAEFLNPNLFTNTIVMIGYSERLEPEKNQGFFTAFSDSGVEAISPIEIAATAVGNLVEHSWIVPLQTGYKIVLHIIWACFLVSICRAMHYKNALIGLAFCGLSYLLVAVWIFSKYFTWVPLIIPIIQLILVVLLSTIGVFYKNKRERGQMQKAFSGYIPDNVINNLTQQNQSESLCAYGELMQGVCLATDAGQYTALAENMSPIELNQLMNSYYSIMFPLVKNYYGIVSDVMGDAMLAIWAKVQAEKQVRVNACKAAIAIRSAIEKFNATQPYYLLTRIGLHFGEMRLGNVGAADHFEYRAVGDVVNTATRIENMNKFLGTHILVSQNVIDDIDIFYTREVGVFILKGKTQPVKLLELINHLDAISPHWVTLSLEFNQALKCFQDYQWEDALELFRVLETKYPQDGPTRFYGRYLRQNLMINPAALDKHKIATIDMGNNLTALLHD